MSDIVHEMTLYAKRNPEPYVRWAGEMIDLKQRLRELEAGLDDAIEINNAHAEREGVYLKRISELEVALEFIRKETLAPNDRLYLHDVANNALKEPPHE